MRQMAFPMQFRSLANKSCLQRGDGLYSESGFTHLEKIGGKEDGINKTGHEDASGIVCPVYGLFAPV